MKGENKIKLESEEEKSEQSLRLFCLLFYRNQPLVKCVEPVMHQWLHWGRTPDLRLVSLGNILQLTANCRSQTAGRKPQVDIQFVSDPGLYLPVVIGP